MYFIQQLINGLVYKIINLPSAEEIDYPEPPTKVRPLRDESDDDSEDEATIGKQYVLVMFH